MLSPLLHHSNDSEASVFSIIGCFWPESCEKMHAFHSLWLFLWFFFFFLSCVGIYFLFFWMVWDVDQLWNHSIAKLPHGLELWLFNCGSLFFSGSDLGHILCLSFFLCPDPDSPLFSWCFLIIIMFSLLFCHGYFSQFVLSGFPGFLCPGCLCFSLFGLAERMFVLHLFLSVVWFDLNWFLFFQENNIFIQTVIE